MGARLLPAQRALRYRKVSPRRRALGECARGEGEANFANAGRKKEAHLHEGEAFFRHFGRKNVGYPAAAFISQQMLLFGSNSVIRFLPPRSALPAQAFGEGIVKTAVSHCDCFNFTVSQIVIKAHWPSEQTAVQLMRCLQI
jgi:hypothetical protein